jgi:hypothetical protein
MLGVPGEAEFTVGRRTLDSGTSLLFYTDGLIEDRRRDISDGLSALAGVMGQVPSLSAEKTCATVQATLLGETPRADDVCLLAVRLTGLARSGATWLEGYIRVDKALDRARDPDETAWLPIRRLPGSDAS